jgi:sugar lactone lactonase YvrE
MTAATEIAAISAERALLGEGALWDPREEAFYWVDIKGRAIHRYAPATGTTRSLPTAEPVGFVALRQAGRELVAGFKSGVVFIDFKTGSVTPFASPEPDRPNNRLNDGKAGPDGALWAGTMDDTERSATGWLYRIGPDASIARKDGPYVVTNGPAFSPDGRVLYHTDTTGRTIYAFDHEEGQLSNKRVFLCFEEGWGHPDGMTTDRDGFLWVAHWGGARVTRFAPDGRVARVIPVPAVQVTNCAFGDTGLDALYITSAAIGRDAKAEPLAGAVFRCEPGVRGLPPNLFAG